MVHEGTLSIVGSEEAIGLPLYTEITGSLALGGPGLTDLEFLRCVDTVGSAVDDQQPRAINIMHADDLETLHGLERLEHVDNVKFIQIQANPKLRSLEGLDGLTTLPAEEGGIIIYGNPALRVLGLRNLEEVRELQIGGRRAGEPIPEPEQEWPPGARTCLPAGNDGLEEIDGLDSLTRFDYLSFDGNVNLVSVAGLEGLAERAEALSPDNPYSPGVGFGLNTSLSIQSIQQTWPNGMGAIQVFTCGNKDEEEPCEPCY